MRKACKRFRKQTLGDVIEGFIDIRFKWKYDFNATCRASYELMDELIQRITTDVNVCGGLPCIRDTRVRVLDVLELLSAGAEKKEILDDYPWLEPDDIRACFAYAARVTAGLFKNDRD